MSFTSTPPSSPPLMSWLSSEGENMRSQLDGSTHASPAARSSYRHALCNEHCMKDLQQPAHAKESRSAVPWQQEAASPANEAAPRPSRVLRCQSASK
jgi:hypothetical protein